MIAADPDFFNFFVILTVFLNFFLSFHFPLGLGATLLYLAACACISPILSEKPSKLENTLNEFESISDTSEVKKMKSILKKARQLEEKSTLRYIHYIICVLDALIHVDTYNCDQLTNLVKPVWNELSTVSIWNHTDLFIINNLLYIFDFQTALRIGKKIITKLNQYGDNNVLLQNAIYSNLAFINMTNSNAFGKSITINYLQKSIELTKHAHRYDLLLLSKIRLAMVLQQYEKAKKCAQYLRAWGLITLSIWSTKIFLFL